MWIPYESPARALEGDPGVADTGYNVTEAGFCVAGARQVRTHRRVSGLRHLTAHPVNKEDHCCQQDVCGVRVS